MNAKAVGCGITCVRFYSNVGLLSNINVVKAQGYAGRCDKGFIESNRLGSLGGPFCLIGADFLGVE